MLACSWSGGKDSALTLHELMKSKEREVVALLTTVTEEYDRITMHGVRSDLLKQQALSIGLPLEEVRLPENITEEDYEETMWGVMSRFKDAGIGSVAFGDLFLEDVRSRREANLARIGMKAVFPLWGRNTQKLALEFVKLGFKAITTCVDTTLLSGEFVGRDVDDEFLSDLPPHADPCGENGEFHSFVYDGPIFKKAIPFRKGDIVVKRGRFNY
ncbi:MAG: diphthine--ammonia ligase, partial [Methanomassiliicoccales archaeon]|nr:diphthine--ammonia ligase [Methanomassiliicoccales archaeon]